MEGKEEKGREREEGCSCRRLGRGESTVVTEGGA